MDHRTGLNILFVRQVTQIDKEVAIQFKFIYHCKKCSVSYEDVNVAKNLRLRVSNSAWVPRLILLSMVGDINLRLLREE